MFSETRIDTQRREPDSYKLKQKHSKNIKKILESIKKPSEYIRQVEGKEFKLASEISIQIINYIHEECDIKEIRKFYLSMMKHYHPELAKLIGEEEFVKIKK